MNRLTTTYSTGDKEPRGFVALERPPNEFIFLRARRHSRRVRILRTAIPIVLAAGLITTFLVIYFNPLRLLAELPSGVGTLILAGTKMSMAEPKLSGFTRDERRYELSASSAAQDKVRADITNLEEPRASLEMLDRSTINLRAAIGYLDRNSGLLTLERDIVLTTSNGYEARLNSAVIDMRNGTVISDQPVEVKMERATLQGNRLEVTKSGEIIRFDGGVSLVIQPEAAAGNSNSKVQP